MPESASPTYRSRSDTVFKPTSELVVYMFVVVLWTLI